MTGIIFLFVVIFAFWLFKRNAKKTRPSEEGSYNAREEGNKAIKAYRTKWYSNFYVTDEQYELISNMENIYLPPENQDFDSYKDPIVDYDQIIDFIRWANIKKSNNNKSSLLEIITNNLVISTPDYFSVDFDIETRDPGAFFLGEDFNAYGFCINKTQYSCNIFLDCADWVKVLKAPKLFDWLNFSDWDDQELWANFDNMTYYLKENNSEFIPPSGDVGDYWDYEMHGDMYQLVKVQPVKDISYKSKCFKINDAEFSFLKKEKDFLIILLMASYRDDLIELIISMKK